MNLSGLKPPCGARKRRKRVGRGDGSGHGGTSCKGAKGQNARAGGRVRPGFEGGQMPLSRRLPKRGFRNYFKRDVVIVNIGQLNKFSKDAAIDSEALLKAGIIKKTGDGVKILAKGDIDRPLSLKINAISRAAREKIEAAGGTVEVI
ncbi:MAG: 50S ribosomal protein L15 [Syntrophales bacterium]